LDFGKLSKLKILVFESSELKAVPREVWDLKSLKEINLRVKKNKKQKKNFFSNLNLLKKKFEKKKFFKKKKKKKEKKQKQNKTK
jgi:hypothetical protein